MGMPASTIGDMTSGHGPYLPQQIDTGSTNVMINDKPAAIANTTQLQIHPAPPPVPPEQPFTTGQGSSTVLINGKGAFRLGDMTVCGGIVISGSNNVLIGG